MIVSEGETDTYSYRSKGPKKDGLEERFWSYTVSDCFRQTYF